MSLSLISAQYILQSQPHVLTYIKFQYNQIVDVACIAANKDA